MKKKSPRMENPLDEREIDSRERIERIQEMKNLCYHTLTVDYDLDIYTVL